MNQVYFENIETEIIKLISSAKTEIKIAMSWFTNAKIFSTLLESLKYGIDIELIINNDLINNNKNSLNFEQFIENGGKLFFFKNEYFMHHKFMIIDNKHVETGSYNFTEIAENINIENIIIISDNEIISKFLVEFANLKLLSDLTSEFKRKHIANNFSVNFVKPNLQKEKPDCNKITYQKHVVTEINFKSILLRNLEDNKIVEIYQQDLDKIYLENEIVNITCPYNFLQGINTKNNFVIGSYITNIIENPQIID